MWGVILGLLLFSLVVMAPKFPSIDEAAHSLFGFDLHWALAFWTCGLILDEWHQWHVHPQTFELDLWNKYDYVSLSSSSLALFLKLGGYDVLSYLEQDQEQANRALEAVPARSVPLPFGNF